MITSHSFIHEDFETAWYKRWAKELRQDSKHLEGYALRANKFWQNAVMTEILMEKKLLTKNKRAIGFGVGNERLPALFAKRGVLVTATDQDFNTVKAGHWAAQELATSAFSLNRLGICSKRQFEQQVEYMPVDMTAIPGSLHGTYDFLWSNCALGHLGSIPAGLDFIVESLKCLQPGGWAVHTTELNILSNTETVTSGSTVVFRLRDINELGQRLTRLGYVVEPFVLTLGGSPADKRISLRPQFGNDFSKIQIMGHLGTQIVLMIHKPLQKPSPLQKIRQQARLLKAYNRNKAVMMRYAKTDPVIEGFMKAKRATLEDLRIRPIKPLLQVTIPRGMTKAFHLHFSNDSDLPVLGLNNRLGGNNPVVLATTQPRDRPSTFRAPSWIGENRVSSDMYQTVNGKRALADYVQPRTQFSLPIELSAKKVRPGTYDEQFSLVQELKGWLPDTTVAVRITVT